MALLEVTAPDISCQHCKRHIERDLAKDPGVRTVHVDVDTKKVEIDYDAALVRPDRLRDALTEIGYPPG